jgi:hydroxyacylglutathione hydrolase
MSRTGRIVRIAGIVVGIVVVLAIAGTLAFRASAAMHGPAEPVSGADRVFRVHNRFVDMYAARTEEGALLFDTGVDASGSALDALLTSVGATRAHVAAVFMTHGHFDHIAGIPLAAAAAVYGGRGDVALARGEEDGGRAIPKLLAAIFRVPAARVTDVVEVPRDIAVAGGREHVLAIPFPGHTSGSTVFLFRGVLFVGDAFNYEDGALGFPPKQFTDDPVGARRSIAALPGLLAGREVNTICTGHGGCTPPEETTALLDDLVGRALVP